MTRLLLAIGLTFVFAVQYDAPATGQTAPRGQGEVRQTVDRIMKGSEYRQLRRQAERKAKKGCRGDQKNQGCEGDDDGCDSCKREGSGGGAPQAGSCAGLAQGLLYLVVLLGVLAIVALIAWSIAKYRRKESEDDEDEDDEEELLPSTPPGEHPSAVYLKRALELADGRDYRGAIRQLLLGGMSWIERHGLIRYRKGLTNRDYLRAVFRRETQRAGLDPLIAEFELVYFGRRQATSERFNRCLKGYRAGFEKDDAETQMAH